MQRREFVFGVGAVAVIGTSPVLCAVAQPVKRVPRICFLTFDPGTPQSPAKRFEAFFERLRELGYVNGETIAIDYLQPEGRSDRYPELAAECLSLNPDIIAVTTTPGAHALKNATTTIPIVLVALGDPVGTKLVDSLGRPGGNITGSLRVDAESGLGRITCSIVIERQRLFTRPRPTASVAGIRTARSYRGVSCRPTDGASWSNLTRCRSAEASFSVPHKGRRRSMMW